MARVLRLTQGADKFTQGSSPDNVGIIVKSLAGDDQIILNRSDDLGGRCIVEAGKGNDVVISFCEDGNQINLGRGNDIYTSSGFGSFATARADTVIGGAGNDVIAVTTFKSIYFGGKGKDTFISEGWQNRSEGGNGLDTISYQLRDEATLAGQGVQVDLAAGQAQTAASRFETLVSIENVIGSSANDVIFGTKGKNVIEGGKGFDEMTGRGGADTFVFRTPQDARVSLQGMDIIHDFSSAQGDRIDFRPIDANTELAGNQAFRFIGTAAFDGKAGRLRVENDPNGMVLQLDRDGDGQADMQIGLVNVFTITAADFLL